MSYQTLTADDVYGLYQDAVARFSIPLTVYDNPGTTHFRFTDDLYEAIAQLPHVESINIPGLPAGQADADARVQRLRERLPDGVTIGVSGDASAATGLLAGCDAWYPVIGGRLPGPALTITHAVQAGDGSGAVAESERLQPLFDLFAQHGGSLRVVAAIAEYLGLTGPSCLPRPIRGLSAEDRSAVTEVSGPARPGHVTDGLQILVGPSPKDRSETRRDLLVGGSAEPSEAAAVSRQLHREVHARLWFLRRSQAGRSWTSDPRCAILLVAPPPGRDPIVTQRKMARGD